MKKHLCADISALLDVPPVKAEELVKLLDLFGITKPGAVDRYDRNAEMTSLAGAVDVPVLAARFGVSKREAYRSIKAHAKRKRALLAVKRVA